MYSVLSRDKLVKDILILHLKFAIDEKMHVHNTSNPLISHSTLSGLIYFLYCQVKHIAES